jgi:hypothetical protein
MRVDVRSQISADRRSSIEKDGARWTALNGGGRHKGEKGKGRGEKEEKSRGEERSNSFYCAKEQRMAKVVNASLCPTHQYHTCELSGLGVLGEWRQLAHTQEPKQQPRPSPVVSGGFLHRSFNLKSRIKRFPDLFNRASQRIVARGL